MFRVTQHDRGETRQPITSISSFAPGMGIARNQNYPAGKNLRRFGANLAGARRFSEILAGANHFRKDVWQLFRAVYSTTVPAAFRIPPKAMCSATWEPRHQARAKMETTHSPEYPRRANRQ